MMLFKGAKRIFKKVYFRVYSDFFMPSRLQAYEALLQEAINLDYEIHSLLSFWRLIKTKGLNKHQKYLILRHDIDTDPKTAREMWIIEQRLGVEASYYFRLSTIDIELMHLIHSSGSEASYHFEEIASYCKQHGIKTNDEVQKNMDQIRREFKDNYLYLREKTNLPLKTVAAHGDFVNRKLGISNEELLKDNSLRKELGIKLEAYDEYLLKFITKRYSDTHAPFFWKPENPFYSLRRNDHVVCILTHPRHWRRNILVNSLDNLKRWHEGFCFSSGLKMISERSRIKERSS